MASYWEDTLFPQFLQSIDSCTISEYTDYDIQGELDKLAIRAIAKFKFPQISLSYSWDDTVNTDITDIAKGYYFDETTYPITQREYNVIVSRMKQLWIEFQISAERNFTNAYYDKEIRMHSPGNTLDKLDKMYKTFKKEAKDTEYDYYRVNADGTSKWGDINE